MPACVGDHRLRIHQMISRAKEDEGLFVLLDSEEGERIGSCLLTVRGRDM